MFFFTRTRGALRKGAKYTRCAFQHIQQGHENAKLLHEFMVLMSVCHTVIPETTPDGTMQYHASSPGKMKWRPE